MNFQYMKLKGDLLPHAVHIELETSPSASGVNMLGIQQCSWGNLFAKTKSKVIQTVTEQFPLGLMGMQSPQLVCKAGD